jgi:alpha-beta hydrolase superfamily lysophospholipase
MNEVRREKLFSDFMRVIDDGQALLKTVSGRTRKGISDVYRDIEKTLFNEREDPWVTVGISVGVGLVLGWIMRRRNQSHRGFGV